MSETLALSAEGELQRRHEDESRQCSRCRYLTIATTEAFRKDLVEDDVGHGAGGEGESQRQQRVEDEDQRDSGQRGQRLGQAGERGVGDGAFRAVALSDQRQRDRESFRHVLDGDTDGEDHGGIDVAAAEGDADGEPLREVVDRYRQDDKPGALQADAGAFGPFEEVEMGHGAVGDGEDAGARR